MSPQFFFLNIPCPSVAALTETGCSHRDGEGTGSRGERKRDGDNCLPLCPYTIFCFPSRKYFSVPFPSGHKPISRKSPRRYVVPHREDIFYFQSIESNLPFSSLFLLFPFSSKTFQTFTQEVCDFGATSSILTYHTREGQWELEFCARFSMDQLRMPQLRGRKEPGIELDRTVTCQTLARSVRYTNFFCSPEPHR